MIRRQTNSLNSSRRVHQMLIWFCALIFLTNANFSTAQKASHPFKPGEKLKYSMNYGWFEVGSAEAWIDPELQYIDSQAYYVVQLTAATTSWAKFFKPVNACFETLVNVETLQPLISRRDLKFGKDIDVRTDRFSYDDSLKIRTYIEDINKNRYHEYKLQDTPLLDFLSTYLHIRSMKLVGENRPIKVGTFYSNTLYEFQMIPGDQRQYNRRNAREYSLQFPKNEMFGKGKHGKLILSDDWTKLPLRIDINLILGSFYFKLEEQS
ncbi:MAG: DUF3108 domain-containing protein [Cyclobacteriaceae bacterium]